MKTSSTSYPYIRALILLGSLALAAAGQIFLIQKDNPATLIPGLLLYGLAVIVFLKGLPISLPSISGSHEPFTFFEGLTLFLISLVALGMRIYSYGDFPNGIFTDEACSAWAGLKIAHENWSLFQNIWGFFPFYPNYVSNTYWSALWFSFFSPTQPHFFLLSVTLSLAAFPFIYYTFRQWAGSRTALLSLYILSVMRWHVTYSRSGHPALEILLYMFGALTFWTKGFRSGKIWSFFPAALLTAAGFEAYQAYYVFIFFLTLYFLFEWRESRWKTKSPWPVLGAVYLVAFAVGWPWFRYLAQRGGLGTPQNGSVFFQFHLDGAGLRSLLNHCLESALQFNRTGDSWSIHNLPFHRLLDDITGLFFVLGFFFAWSRLSQRKYLYALMGFLVMSLPAFLSKSPTSASRMMGTTPFIALLVALTLETVEEKIKEIAPKTGPKWWPGLLTGLLAFMTFQNFHTYFDEQVQNYDCRRLDSPQETAVGNAVRNAGNSCEDYLSSRFFGHYTVMFLGYFQMEHMHEMKLPESLMLPNWSPGQSILFAFDEGQIGVKELVRSLYPGGQIQTLEDPQGHTIVFFYKISSEEALKGRKNTKRFLRTGFGLKGTYWSSLYPQSPPVLLHEDPLINFTFRNDFPVRQFPPLKVHWKGFLNVRFKGTYHFLSLATDPVQMALDGKTVLSSENQESKGVLLKKGRCSIEVDFQKLSGTDTALSLLWKKPRSVKYEVIPAMAFRH
jgi:hypothetical protein